MHNPPKSLSPKGARSSARVQLLQTKWEGCLVFFEYVSNRFKQKDKTQTCGILVFLNLLFKDYKNAINFKFILKIVALTSFWQSILLKIHEKQLWKVILTFGSCISWTLPCFIQYFPPLIHSICKHLLWFFLNLHIIIYFVKKTGKMENWTNGIFLL